MVDEGRTLESMNAAVNRKVKKDFGTRLARLAMRRGLIQSELARRSGVSRGLISSYIQGRNLPREDNLMRIAQVLGVTPEELLPLDEYERLSASVLAQTKLPAFEPAPRSSVEVQIDEDDPRHAWLTVSRRRVPARVASTIMQLLLESDEDGAGDDKAADRA